MELLAFCCQKEKLALLLDLDELLDPALAERYRELTVRLAGHEPMAYLTGNVVFGGREFHIAPGVLIPRDDTMTLVRQALARLDLLSPYRILELGCGSGAVIATLALERPHLQCLATDIDALAIAVARENLSRHDIAGRVQVFQGNWFEPLGREDRQDRQDRQGKQDKEGSQDREGRQDRQDRQDKFHLILSNPPYISAVEMAELPESVKKEPETALWGGEDGLDCFRELLPDAFDRLEDNGWCLMEIGWKQGQAVKALFESAGYCDVSIHQDEAGRDRVVAGRRMKYTDKEVVMATKVTQCWQIHDAGDPRIAEAGHRLSEGSLVAFPTETVYGLGANGLDEKAAAGIYEAKGRPADNPLILHVSSIEDAKALAAKWSDKAELLASKLWPGPLTMVLPAATHIPKIVTAGLNTIAIRYPSDPIALALIEAAGVPVAAPSANVSGRPSPTRAEHVLEDMDGRIDIVIDSGPCKVGLESTIIDLSVEPPAILRPGDVTVETLRRIIGEVRTGENQAEGDQARGDRARGDRAGENQTHEDQAGEHLAANTGYHDEEGYDAPKAPGMKYRHYAPMAPVTVLQGEPCAVARYVAESLLRQPIPGKDSATQQKTGLLLSVETWRYLAMTGIQPEDQDFYYRREMGSHDQPREMGALLYEALRACDREGMERIYVEACSPEGQGAAVLNRLRKAAGNVFIQVG
jgi:L-threonylcarbamoyladenylate synthase